jgi:hypothetical protein
MLLIGALLPPDDFAAALPDDLNIFDAPLCDGAGAASFGALLSAAPRLFATRVLAFAGRFAAAFRTGGVLGDFLRDFLDIRLPFVAFHRSIIGLLQVSTSNSDSALRLGKSDGAGVWLQGIRCTSCSLVD